MSIFPDLFPPGGSSGPLVLGGWDTAELGGEQLPGKCRARASIQLKRDKKDAAGRHGGKPTLHGITPQPVEIDVHVWTQEQLDALTVILKNVLPAPNLDQVPIGFDHPQVRHLGIDKIVILGASELKPSSEVKGGYMVTIRADHWLPEEKSAQKKSATSTPTRSVKNRRTKDAEEKKRAAARPSKNNGVVAPNQSTSPPLQSLPG